MKPQDICPSCQQNDLKELHRLRIADVYKEPETNLRATNDYRRNYILFEHLLRRSTDSFEVEFRLCGHCGLIFFSPRPDEADLLVKYKLVGAERDTVARENLRRLVDQRGRRAREIRQRIAPYLGQRSGNAIDLGGADGHCLGALTSDCDCYVVDYEDRESWPGVRKLAGTLEDLPADFAADVILCCHTLEHVPNVNLLIQNITRRLTEGGIVYLEVPQGCTGEIYVTRNVLTHINFFSRGSLGFLLEHCGLHVEILEASPVLTSKKYSPVVWAVARKNSTRKVAGHYLREGAAITRVEMTHLLTRRVFFANLALVLSQPWAYMQAYAGYLRRHFQR